MKTVAIMIGAKDVSLEYPTKRVLDKVTIGISDGDRIGIVGRNGDGKSTLLNVLAGLAHPDNGEITYRSGVSVGMLTQQDLLADKDTVLSAVVGDLPEYVWAGDRRTRSIMEALLENIDLDACVGTLSGGQRRRVDLARVLVGTWDVLMLDEPTNHLDVRAITWLSEHLQERWATGQGALLVITHDRWFLDEVALEMWEVHDGIVEAFEGGYSAYIQQRAERAQMAQSMEQKRQNLIRRELAWLSRGARARSSKPKFHVKAARELIAEDPPLRDERELKRMAMTRLGKQVFELSNVELTRDGKALLSSTSWVIGPGDRIGILGDNGAGKTSILKLLAGKLSPTSGSIKTGATVNLGILSQRLEDLEAHSDVYVRELLKEYRRYLTVGKVEMSATQILDDLGFDERYLKSRVCDLSGGQKRILQFALMLFKEPNVLLLDEPGNDLDTDMLAALETLLDGWAGTIILVSHDRHLLERVTDNQYALIDSTLKHLPGGVDQYLELVASPDNTDGSSEVETGSLTSRTSCNAAEKTNVKNQALSNQERRARTKELASNERKLETQREKLADAKRLLEKTDPTDYAALEEAMSGVSEIQEVIDELELIWLELTELLDE